MIVIISLFCSAAIIATGLLLRKRSHKLSDSNEDLLKFYDLLDEPASVQLKQLVLAAGNTLRRLYAVSAEKEAMAVLFEERVLSEESFRRVSAAEEDLVIEKALIEDEADALRSGAGEQVFAEAGKHLGGESVKKRKVFDEALFLKKRENLRKDLHERTSK